MARAASFAQLAPRPRSAWSPAYPKVLAFGDSITFGAGSTDGGGYRSKLQALAYSDGVPIRFVGTQAAGPATVSGLSFLSANEGHPGYTIANTPTPSSGITELVATVFPATTPDIVLLHIGVNDVNYSAGLPTMLDRLTTLVQTIFNAAPRCRVVLAKNTVVNMGPLAAWDTYVAGVPGVAATFASSGYICTSVDMSVIPWSTTDFADGVHPNDSGYAKMAGIWYGAIRRLL